MSFDVPTVTTALMILAAIVLQAAATLRVRRDTSSSPEQKGLQVRLIWLVPVLGAALVLAVLHEAGGPASRTGDGDRAGRDTSSSTRA